MRIPAWTDRILFKGSKLRQLTYDYAKTARVSDHRPVHSVFDVEVQYRSCM